MKTLTLLSMAAAVSLATSVSAVELPNVFVSGQAASATQVNDNFTALVDGVNANVVLISDNAVEIGKMATVASETAAILERLVAMEAKLAQNLRHQAPIVELSSGIELGLLLDGQVGSYRVLAKNNQVVRYVMNNDNVSIDGLAKVFTNDILYTAPNCTGAGAYAFYADSSIGKTILVHDANDDVVVKQIVSDFVPESIDVESRYINSECMNMSWTANVITDDALLPNDYAVSGIPNVDMLNDVTLTLIKPTL